VRFTPTTDPATAAQALADGQLAVIPTETVYGLGAQAEDPVAVARVFAAKGRPVDHPLIVHVRNNAAVQGWVRSVPEYAIALMDELWPGPLTVVLPRSERVADYLTGGQDTVAVRVPGSPVMREVLRALGEIVNDESIGIAAPSANRFGRVSPTTAQHAAEELGEALADGDVVLDAGPCVVGLESTIVDCSGSAPVILRPGKVTAEQIEKLAKIPLADSTNTRAPGTLASHYSPAAKVRLTSTDGLAVSIGNQTTGVIAMATVPTPPGVVRISAPHSIEEYAAGLYRALREADSLGLRLVLAVPPEGSGLAEAIRDRLQRAAHE